MKIIVFILLFFPSLVYGSVVINEIAWMGTNNSANDEWIELYSDESINLDGWVLKADDGSPEIKLEGIINGFYLLERTDDESNPNKPANLIYAGSLSNSGENLRLINSSGKVVDEVLCQDGWTGGDNKTKETLKRTNNIEIKPQYIESPPEAELQVKSLTIYPSNIVFNELLPSPEGADSENEWIELYNQNDYEVDLTDWLVRDTTGSSKSYALNDRIAPYGYLLLKRPETGITLNNDGDGLILINPNEEVIDSVNFGKADQNKSYIRTSSEWTWTTTLTPGKKNIITRENTKKIIPSILKEDKSEEIEKVKTTKLVDNLDKTSKSPFLTAFLLAILSGIAFLIIKNNLKAFWY